MSADELIDVVDAQDRVLRQATRGDVRRHNLRHRAVYLLVFNAAGQLFVHQRTTTKDIWPGYWDVAVGGVLAAEEGYDDGARRELEEEIGVRDVSLRRLFPLRYEDDTNRVCGVVYSCTCDGTVSLQASEIACGDWMDLDVVIERTQALPFCPDGIEVLRLYLSRLDEARRRQ
jgi:isopentenyldiphosphate isomerase